MHANNFYANPASGVFPSLSEFRLQAAAVAKLQRADRIPRRRCLNINYSAPFIGSPADFCLETTPFAGKRRDRKYARSLKLRLATAA